MSNKFINLLYIFFIILLIGLFYFAFTFNISQKNISQEALTTNLKEALQAQKKMITRYIQNEERAAFKLFNSDNDLAERCRDHNLFLMKGRKVIPACSEKMLLDYPLEIEAAKDFYNLGLKAENEGKIKESLDFFDVAVKGPIVNPDTLEQKLNVYNHLLLLRKEEQIQIMFDMLYLLDYFKKIKLPELRKKVFYQSLEDNVDEFISIKKRYNELWTLAASIEKKIKNRNIRLKRYLHNTSLLSIDKKKRIYLSSKNWLKGLPVQLPVKLSTIVPDGKKALYSEKLDIQPPIHLYVLIKEILLKRESIQKQYKINSLILQIMAFLCFLLIIGIVFTLTREKKLARVKVEFIRSASHELRTPLALIRLFSETLFHGRVKEEKKQEYYQNILFESERLSGLVNNVLDFSRMSSGRRQYSFEKTDISELCIKTADSFSFRIKKEGFVLKKKVKKGLLVRIDKLAFSQVLFNLLDNALKYSEKKKEIEIILEKKNNNIILKVKDKGIGIPNKIKGKIFNEFFRADDQRVSSQRGSGIGLNVTKRMIEDMNGRINVQDNKPHGAVFIIVFPAVQEKKA